MGVSLYAHNVCARCEKMQGLERPPPGAGSETEVPGMFLLRLLLPGSGAPTGKEA